MGKNLLVAIILLGCFIYPFSSSAAPSKNDTKSQNNSKQQEVKQADEFVDFGSEQVMLNNQAAEATNEENYQKAEGLYTALLQIGEVNIVWHNLGKTYSKQNKCLEAFDAFAHVDGAPKMRDLPPEDLHQAKEKAVEELRKQCSASIVMKCNPGDMLLSVDGGREIQCNGQSQNIPLVPGRHSVYGKTEFGFNTVNVTAVADTAREYKIDVINYEEIAAKSGATIEALQKRSKLFRVLGWTFLGVGVPVAAAGGGLAGFFYSSFQNDSKKCRNQQNKPDAVSNASDDNCNDLIEGGKREKEERKWEKIGFSMVGVGSALAVTGITLLIYDAVKIIPQLEDLKSMMSFDISPVFSQDYSGIAVVGSF